MLKPPPEERVKPRIRLSQMSPTSPVELPFGVERGHNGAARRRARAARFPTRKGADHATCDRWRNSGARDGGAAGSSRPGPRARAGQEDRLLDSLGAESRVQQVVR